MKEFNEKLQFLKHFNLKIHSHKAVTHFQASLNILEESQRLQGKLLELGSDFI